jgi:glycosyltransferase involved in cell wall biosynthesis
MDTQDLSFMPSSRRYGKQEKKLSLFQIDAGREWRGGQRQSLLFAKELKRNGYVFHLAVQPGSPLHQKASDAGLPVLPLKISGEADVRSILRLSWEMKRKKCRLAHFHDAHSVAVGSAAASMAKVPIRVISRRVDFPIKRNVFSRRKYTKDVDAIIAVSDGVKKVLVESGIDARLIRVIPDGIDFTPYENKTSKDYLRQELSFAPDDFLVGIVAQLSDDKGHKYLIQASKYLRQRAPNIKIVIVGEGPLRLELNKQVKQIQSEDMVFFLGFREDIPQIMNSLDVFVLSSEHEGLGSILMDAMACRLPIVATRVGGIPEVVDHRKTGLLVPPQRPKSLASAIIKLYDDRELAYRLGKEGFDVVHRKFSSASMSLHAIDLYEELAKKKGVRFVKYP